MSAGHAADGAAEHRGRRVGHGERRRRRATVVRHVGLLDLPEDDLEQIADGRVLHIEQHERAEDELFDVLAAANLRREVLQRDVLEEREGTSVRAADQPVAAYFGLVVHELNVSTIFYEERERAMPRISILFRSILRRIARDVFL